MLIRLIDNELGPEMDKLFSDFMDKIQKEDPESANAFENMGKMF
jgi:Pex19 protein family